MIQITSKASVEMELIIKIQRLVQHCRVRGRRLSSWKREKERKGKRGGEKERKNWKRCRSRAGRTGLDDDCCIPRDRMTSQFSRNVRLGRVSFCMPMWRGNDPLDWNVRLVSIDENQSSFVKWGKCNENIIFSGGEEEKRKKERKTRSKASLSSSPSLEKCLTRWNQSNQILSGSWWKFNGRFLLMRAIEIESSNWFCYRDKRSWSIIYAPLWILLIFVLLPRINLTLNRWLHLVSFIFTLLHSTRPFLSYLCNISVLSFKRR